MNGANPDEPFAALAARLRGATAALTEAGFPLEAAAAAGLIDVAYTLADSPVGQLLLARSARGLVTIAYLDTRSEDDVLARLARAVSARVLRTPRRLDGVRRELDEYFAGRRTAFAEPVDLSLTAGFTRRVLEATAQIPYGAVSSYAGVAAAAGSPRAIRAAGNALGANPLPIVVPCHRVLRSGGALGGYTGGLERKRILLGIESAHGSLPGEPAGG